MSHFRIILENTNMNREIRDFLDIIFAFIQIYFIRIVVIMHACMYVSVEGRGAHEKVCGWVSKFYFIFNRTDFLIKLHIFSRRTVL